MKFIQTGTVKSIFFVFFAEGGWETEKIKQTIDLRGWSFPLLKKTDLPSELLLDGRSVVLYVEILFLRDLQCKYAIAVFKRVSLTVVIQRFTCGK